MTYELSKDKRQDTEVLRDMIVGSKTYVEHRKSNCSNRMSYKKQIINRQSVSSIMSFSVCLLCGTEVNDSGEKC